jgi:hypothetical protein
MATRPELNPNSGAPLAMNDDVGRCASRIRHSASRTPRNCGYAHIVGMQQGHAGPHDVVEDVTVLGQARCPERPEIRLADPRLNQRVWVDE